MRCYAPGTVVGANSAPPGRPHGWILGTGRGWRKGKGKERRMGQKGGMRKEKRENKKGMERKECCAVAIFP